jgi:transcriptional regulator with XRE-family HTH domain
MEGIMYKRMLGETIYQLRKAKGISQAELGELVGVSNKAVSKWETYEANPDITLLPLLAESLGVTADELLTDIKAEKNDPKAKEAKVFGLDGMLLETPDEYEFISERRTKKDQPFLHIHIGKKIHTMNAKARGLIAIGNNAKGIISIGVISAGIVSIGILSLGLLSLGVLGLGLASIAAFAFGGVSIGAVSVGLVSIGAISIGYYSVGAVAIGYYAQTSIDGYAFGKNIFIH